MGLKRFSDNCLNTHDSKRNNSEEYNPEWTQSQMTQSRMDTIPNGYNPEWAQSGMGTFIYI